MQSPSSEYSYIFFFFNDTATTEIYTLSLHDALPICAAPASRCAASPPYLQSTRRRPIRWSPGWRTGRIGDRKSTRLNSSHVRISYAVFCLKKKKTYFSTPVDLSTDEVNTKQSSLSYD